MLTQPHAKMTFSFGSFIYFFFVIGATIGIVVALLLFLAVTGGLATGSFFQPLKEVFQSFSTTFNQLSLDIIKQLIGISLGIVVTSAISAAMVAAISFPAYRLISDQGWLQPIKTMQARGQARLSFGSYIYLIYMSSGAFSLSLGVIVVILLVINIFIVPNLELGGWQVLLLPFSVPLFWVVSIIYGIILAIPLNICAPVSFLAYRWLCDRGWGPSITQAQPVQVT